jgi:hypothetical protein
MILLDGAAAQVLIHRDPAYALAAGQAAAALVTKYPAGIAPSALSRRSGQRTLGRSAVGAPGKSGADS